MDSNFRREKEIEVQLLNCKTHCLLNIVHKVCKKCNVSAYPIHFNLELEKEKASKYRDTPMIVKIIFKNPREDCELIENFISEFMDAVNYRFGYMFIDYESKDETFRLVRFTQWTSFPCKIHDPKPANLYEYKSLVDEEL